VPRITSLEAFHRAVAEFVVADVSLVIEPAALAAARRSLDRSGLLLLGEMHGVRENPLLIRALMQAFGLASLALEWPEDLAPAVQAFLAAGTLADHPWLWGGDGRITAGHLAVLAERAAAGPLQVILFDGLADAGWSWSQRDEAMAQRILRACPPGARTLAVAGNAHTATSRTHLGVPLGACLARQRPGIREIRISYGGGYFYNFEPRPFAGQKCARRPIRLCEDGRELILDLPLATEAAVPHRPQP
jgi:erythromycin esterase-like protein